MDGTVGTLLAEQDVGWLEVTVYDARLRELRLVRVRVGVRVGVRVRVRSALSLAVSSASGRQLGVS